MLFYSFLIILAGFPAITELLGKVFFVTTDPAPTVEFEFIIAPGKTIEPKEIKQSGPMNTLVEDFMFLWVIMATRPPITVFEQIVIRSGLTPSNTALLFK